MPLFDFECSMCGKVTEEIVGNKIIEIACECGHIMKKLFSGKVSFRDNGKYTEKSGYGLHNND